MEYYVNVVLPIPLERLFTYQITNSQASLIKPGMRVAVPFGKTRIYTALVMEIHHLPPDAYEAKPIHQLLDEIPIVAGIQLQHWQWIAKYYMCTFGEVFRTAVPSALLLESETVVLKNNDPGTDETGLSEDEFIVVEALEHRGALKVNEISNILEKKTVLPILNSLVRKRAIVLKEELIEQYKPKMLRHVRLASKFQKETELQQLLDSLKRAPKQVQAVLALFQLEAESRKPVLLKSLQHESRVSPGVIRSLLDKGILEEYSLRTDRVVYQGNDPGISTLNLNDQQSEALNDIRMSFKEGKVTLLHGVTSSGKTELYVKLIEDCLGKNQQVLYLLPEIALTAQLIERLKAYFGSNISVYHSRYNVQERVEVWFNVLGRKAKAQLIIGARSAMFLPYSGLGLIIVDEEHENSYKQFDPAPRYHARDAAIVLGQMHGAKVLLGSATPSIESYFNVKKEKYGYASLTRRYGNVQLPEMELVDLKELTRKKKLKGHFSDRLIALIHETLEAGEQVILFQNRRGFAPIVECTSCGHSPGCPNCDVSLTYHRHRNQLRCHYCGHHTDLQPACVACGNHSLDTKGFGTQQLEDEAKALFDKARIGRMDFDTTRGKHAHARIIHAFEQGEIDILVGTQMLTKGLDFRHVNLVGIMNADTLLNFPDFRAHERSYQMLTQVAGRAGRTEKRGKVIIQTYNPYHQILQQVTTGEYDRMFSEQIYEREQFKYPPHNRIIRITLKHKEYNRLNEAAEWFARSIRLKCGPWVLGPEFPPIPRIRNQYLKHILIKIPRELSHSKIKNSIKRLEQSFNAISQYKGVRIIYDVDYT
ncbi:MAG: replication restart helicase PriA [Flavobacteriaceae bacterium]